MHRTIVPRTLSVLLVLAAIAQPLALGVDKSSTDTSTVAVSDAQNGKDVDLNPGQTLEVNLKMVAGTGYDWTVSGDPAPLKLIKMSHERSKGKSGTPGAPTTAVFRFNANSPGVTTLTLVYRRSWEYNVSPAKTFTLRVNVR